jgi:RHS repeat-associated protein
MSILERILGRKGRGAGVSNVSAGKPPGSTLSPWVCLLVATAAFACSKPAKEGVGSTSERLHVTSGLVAAYDFDEGSGTTAADVSGSGNTGTLLGPTWSTTGRRGGALSFDGVNDRVTIPDASSLDLTTGVTLMAWVRPAGGETDWRTVVLKESASEGFSYALYATDGTGVPGAYLRQGSQDTSVLSNHHPPRTERWTHLAATYDGSAFTFYVNGKAQNSASVSGSITTGSGVLDIGGNSIWGEWFHGLIDEVRVYSRGLSASEVALEMDGVSPGPAPTLVAAYGFDEGSGSAAADASGSSNTGALSGPAWVTTGKHGGALQFDGVDDRVLVADSSSLDLTYGITLMAWVKPVANSDWRSVILKERENDLGYALYSSDNAGLPIGYVNHDGAGVIAQGPTALPLDTWSHLALTHDDIDLKFYVDGQLVNSQNYDGDVLATDGDLSIGGNAVWGEWFEGLIDDVRIYNNGLSAAQVAADMNTGVGGSGGCGSGCDDGNACNGVETCVNGSCASGTPVTCTASDQCHDAGTCNPSTGVCSNPAKADGSACNDTNACTQTDTCQSGTCTGSNPVTCSASDQCHDAGSCDTSTGVCSNPAKANGSACNDATVCNGSETCQSGSCTPGTPPTITDDGNPCTTDACDAVAGITHLPAPAGTSCSNGNACDGAETCNASATCVAGTPPTTNDGNPCTTDACDPVAGVTHAPVASGTLCLDANACNGAETCNASGTCVAGTPPTLDDNNPCTTDACDPTTGVSHTPVAAGTTCGGASNACTGPATCDSAGTCQPGTPIEPTANRVLADAAAFLFSGSSPIQTGVAAGAIKPDAIAVIRGQVRDPSGEAILQVSVTVVDRPEFGSTSSRTADGGFDMAVNGGQTLRLRFELPGYLPVERTVTAPRQDYVVLGDVVLTPPDALATTVDVSGASPGMQVARSTPSTDGGRQATLLVPPGTVAVMTLPDGSAESLPSMHFRATQYSVETLGPNALPATPPSGTSDPYAVELSADEAIEAGASLVEFSQPLSFYLENYVGLPVGTAVPHGFYSSGLGSWVSSSTGLVLEILGVSGGMAQLDVDGDGTADAAGALATLGITDLERSQLATLYQEGETVWRIPLAHFSTHAIGNPVAPKNDCPGSRCLQPFPDGSPNPNGEEIPCVVDDVTELCPWLDPSCPGCEGNMRWCNDPTFCQGKIGANVTVGGCSPAGNYLDCSYFCCPNYYGIAGATFGDYWCEAAASAPTTCDYPPPPFNPDGVGPGECDQPHASTIHCQRQALGEEVAVAGTPYVLNYQSDRQRGRLPELHIPVTTSPPPGLLGVEMTVSVAGRTFPYTFGPYFNQSVTFQWDGLDAYGRAFQGSQPVTVQTSYVFESFYQSASAFGLNPTGDRIEGLSSPKPLTVTSWRGHLGTWDARLDGLGGWSLNVQHVFDVASRNLRRGDGSNRTLASVPPMIETVAGTGSAGPASGDGGAATSAVVPSPSAVAVRGDGSLLISDGASCIRQVDAQGMITRFAGQCAVPGFAGDGGLALDALLQTPRDIAIGADGNVYIADTLNHRIRRVAPNGVITTVAGSGPTGAQAGQFSGDDGPAIDARFSSPSGVDVSRSGVLYIADTGNGRVRSVAADGVVRTVAGNGEATSSNEEIATLVSLSSPQRVRVAANGTLYLTEPSRHRVQRVARDGKIYRFAGTGAEGYLGDGGKAQNALLTSPSDIAVQADDSVVILDQNNTIRLVSPLGIISTLAGVAGAQTHAGDRGFAAAASFGPAKGIGVGADGAVYLAATSDNRVRRIAPGLRGFSGGPEVIKIPSSDGKVVHTFDPHGRHLSDTHALTGAVLTSFDYDCDGRLTSVTDADGKVTQIQRDSAGNPTAIVDPFGHSTTLTLDANGYLATVTDPNQATTTFTYGETGLMMSRLDANGRLANYMYDEVGRLIRDTDPAGGAKFLTRSTSANGFTVNMSTVLGVQSTYETRFEPGGTLVRANNSGGASRSSLSFSAKGITTAVSADGTKTVSTPTPDPRFGVLAPVLSVATTTPTQHLTRVEASSRNVTYSGENLATVTETTSVNGKNWLRHFDATTRTWTTTSPLGRQSATVIDAAGRPTSVAVSGVTPRSTSFDLLGRPSFMTQGTRHTTFGYFNAGAANGYLQSITDASNTATTFSRDALGRTLAETRAATTTSFGWDPEGNLSSVTPPGKPAHEMNYTPVNLLESYEPPPAGLPASATSYDYDLDRMLRTETRPDGVSIVRTPDSAGRLDTVEIPGGLIEYDYVPSNVQSGGGKVSSIVGPYGVDLAFAYDGLLTMRTTWSGDVRGSVTWQHNNDFQKILETVSGATGTASTAFGYDNDLLLTCASPTTCSPPGADALRLTRHPQHGMVTGITLGQTSETWSYNQYGELARQTASFDGSPLVDIVYDEAGFERDALGRIVRKTETILGVTKVYEYRYDALRRLDQVKIDGVVDEEFTYDANGNRLTAYKAGVGTVSATYDDQDRLLTYGTYEFTYTANGELETKTNTANGDEWLFEYDTLGNLASVGLPNGDLVEYLVDGRGRRVGKKKNGVLLKQWIYRDALKPVAELNGSGSLVAQFVYGATANVPEYMVRGGAMYRVMSDHLGSPRRVVNVANSADVPFTASYTSFGEVTGTGLDWMPFGFAGGVYDSDTELLRFGARDIDSRFGRWLSKDPIRFDAGPHFYGYVENDPINHVDPFGHEPFVTTTIPSSGWLGDALNWFFDTDAFTWPRPQPTPAPAAVPICGGGTPDQETKNRCHSSYLSDTAYCGEMYPDDYLYDICMSNAWRRYIRCLNGLSPDGPLVPRRK